MLVSFIGVADYGAFVVAVIVFLLIPGPGNLALITSTSKGGVAGGPSAFAPIQKSRAFLIRLRGCS